MPQDWLVHFPIGHAISLRTNQTKKINLEITQFENEIIW